VSAVVLMYHRVADVRLDAYGLAVSTARFAEHVELLTRLGCVVPLAEVTRPGATRLAVTFDDGYADNATAAAPLLQAAGLPATYFITTGRLGGRRFWWDRLAFAFLGEHSLPPGIDVPVAGRDH
jgi:peptidoglycan/xylan/chitin deacetylase (PgdA/CDA1 family)